MSVSISMYIYTSAHLCLLAQPHQICSRYYFTFIISRLVAAAQSMIYRCLCQNMGKMLEAIIIIILDCSRYLIVEWLETDRQSIW